MPLKRLHPSHWRRGQRVCSACCPCAGDVYYFCGSRMQYCTCGYRWNLAGWNKAIVLWGYVLTTTLGVQRLLVQLVLQGLLPGEQLQQPALMEHQLSPVGQTCLAAKALSSCAPADICTHEPMWQRRAERYCRKGMCLERVRVFKSTRGVPPAAATPFGTNHVLTACACDGFCALQAKRLSQRKASSAYAGVSFHTGSTLGRQLGVLSAAA